MLAAISFLVIVMFSMVVVKIGAVLLEATGLSKDVASFQAQSAFSGVGFTTNESENIVNHPVRRKVLRILMLFGSAGLTSAIATLIITFVNKNPQNNFMSLMLIIGVLLVFFTFGLSKISDKLIRLLLAYPLKYLKKRVYLYDYDKLLGLSYGYTIGSFEVWKNHWMANRKLRSLKMENEGIYILGLYRKIDREERFLGTPSDTFEIHPGDKIIVYTREENLDCISRREKGAQGNLARKEAEKRHQGHSLIRESHEDDLTKLVKADLGKPPAPKK